MSENTDTALTVIQQMGIARPPSVVLREAHEAAEAVKGIVEAKPKKVVINGETYLEFEDWQTVARFYGIAVQITNTQYVQYGDATGFEATAEAVHVETGRVVSRAEAMCLNDEDRWNKRPLFQIRSMAQTRAGAKALRNCLAWVVVLAGYRPTPAEEMVGDEGKPVGDKSREHWCAVHGAEFFKRGKMKSFAHPYIHPDDASERWCHESTKADAPEAPKQAMKAPAASPTTAQGETGVEAIMHPQQRDPAWDALVGKGHEHTPPRIDWINDILPIALKMDVKGTDLPKALGLKKPDVNLWTETRELALDTIEAYARSQGYAGPKWRSIKL